MSFIDILNHMKQCFDASPHKDLYRSTALGELFCSDNLPSAWDFCNIYLNSSEATRSWFKSCLEDFRYQNLFVDLEIILLSMQEQNILNHENIHALESHEDDEPLIVGLRALEMEGILNQDNLHFICSSTCPYHLSNALITLNQGGILNPDNRDIVVTHPDPVDLASALNELHDAEILTPDNRDIVATHPDPVGLASALNVLQDAEILTPDNRDIIANTHSLEDLIGLLIPLQIQMLLNQENFELIAGHRDIKALKYVLNALCRADLLNQANFDVLMQAHFAPLITEYAVQQVWSRIPRHFLNQATFNRFLITAEGDDIVNELTVVLNQNLVNAPAAPRARPIEDFNDAQSTHTASVHRTVSISAYNLETSYGEDLNLEPTIVEIKDYVNHLDDSLKNAAAKRCIERLTDSDYNFTDSVSGISTYELLALAWHSIHDEAKCQGTLNARRALFIEGLYEIQRCYNLNEAGEDNLEADDYPSCDGGTFNKIIEKLMGIHADVEINYITHQGAMLKFPRLVQTYALKYLNELIKHDVTQSREVLEQLAEKGMEIIWDKLKVQVEDALWNEFKEAYAGDREHPNFRAMMDSGQYVELPNFDELNAQLSQSIARESSKPASVNELRIERLRFFEAQNREEQEKSPSSSLGA